ncbi:type IV pilus assembly protein PilV [Desulfonatronum thiosulfatophilum]|uniref:Type IV pilus assembly protein PilV n=1 Tax=Desulfonatronum thiosulfatophilum TaxID=617002 RepID=A0A1G6A2S6_9BACT|nr:type IV pilus modification protein PilV [Desulfonatronum thiosulfatophilum]SDB02729.1 type IV pilus assembly protein PilV [Desulfonatronum thiosulfatophilum]
MLKCIAVLSPTNVTLDKRPAAGFTLLEVLVGLIILAIGLLGLAGMQMVSLRQNNDAYLRSQATLQAYDILDRMRANRTYALNGRYVVDFEEEPAANLPSAVKFDLEQWKETLAVFPGPGDGAIEMIDDTVVLITIKWRESREDDAQWQEFWTQSEL